MLLQILRLKPKKKIFKIISEIFLMTTGKFKSIKPLPFAITSMKST